MNNNTNPGLFKFIIFFLALFSAAELLGGLIASITIYPEWQHMVLVLAFGGAIAGVIINGIIQNIFPMWQFIIPNQYPKLAYTIIFIVISNVVCWGVFINRSQIKLADCKQYSITRLSEQRTRNGPNYSARIDYDGRTFKLPCNKQFYESYHEGDSVTVCLNKGLLGFSFLELDKVFNRNKNN